MSVETGSAQDACCQCTNYIHSKQWDNGNPLALVLWLLLLLCGSSSGRLALHNHKPYKWKCGTKYNKQH
jgi:hypothetical protein